MFRAHAENRAETERIAVQRPVFVLVIVDFVHDDDNGLARTPQNLRDIDIRERRTFNAVNDEQDRITFRNGALNLLPYSVHHGLCIVGEVAPRVDDIKAAVLPRGDTIQPVPGHSGKVVHNRFPATDHSVEKR